MAIYNGKNYDYGGLIGMQQGFQTLDPNNDPVQHSAAQAQYELGLDPTYASALAQAKAEQGNKIYQAIKNAVPADLPEQYDQTWIQQLADMAPQLGMNENSDWSGMLSKMNQAQMGQFGGYSPADAHQMVAKFLQTNGLDPSGQLTQAYVNDPRTRAMQQRDDAFQSMLSNNGSVFDMNDFSTILKGVSVVLGAGAAGGLSGLDAGMGAYDMAGASSAVGGGGAGWAGNTLGDATWGVNARDGGGMYDNLYGDSADLIDAYGGNQSTLGNVDEFGNNIYGGQQGLNSPDAPNWWDDPLGGTNNAPIPAEGIQKLVDAGVPWEIASKMSVSGLKSLMSMAQSKGGSAGGNNPWAGLLAAGLGVLGSRQQTNSLNNLSRQFAEYGAPSRARYESSYQPGFTMANDPGFTDALNLTGKASANAQSVTNGNPTGSPNAQMQINKDIFSQFAYPALQNYRNQNANSGGISSFNSAAPQAGMAAIQSQGNTYNALGAGINDIFNPKPTLAQSMADYRRLSEGLT